MRKLVFTAVFGLIALSLPTQSFASPNPNAACLSQTQYAATKFAMTINGGCPKGSKLFNLGFPANATVISLLNDVAKGEYQLGFNNGAGAMKARCLGGWFPPAPGQPAIPPTC
jgi:hypothetical protein